MRAYGVAAPLAAGIALAMSSLVAPSWPLPRKCGVQVDEPLVALDGAVVEAAAHKIDRDRIFAVEIVCMDPVDSTFSMRPGIPVISIWTKDGPVPHMKPLLAEVLKFQRSHHESLDKYATNLRALDRSAFPNTIDVSLHVADRGWMAVASVPNLLSRCVVWDGLWPSPHHTTVAGEPTCLSRHEVHEAGSRLEGG